MGEYRPHRRTTSRLGPRDSEPGKILVQVEGGHLVRSVGRKDRHSKVCTSKGPRDRRVQLAAHTAIQFYDVQDRLGFDRPSKAVDWLIKKAKASIDELNHLPSTYVNFKQQGVETRETHRQQYLISIHNEFAAADHMNMNPSCFIPPSVDSDAMESIFPTTTNFHHLHHHHNQLYQSPIASCHTDEEQVFFTETTATTTPFPVLVGLDGTPPAWSEQQQQQPSCGAAEWLALELGQNGIFSQSQRGPLQSSISTPSFHAWMDHSPAITIATGGGDHIHHPETGCATIISNPNIWGISHSSW